MHFLTKLAEIANKLDAKGAYEESAVIDEILRLAAEPGKPMSYLERSRQQNKRLKEWSAKQDATRKQRVQQQQQQPATQAPAAQPQAQARPQAPAAQPQAAPAQAPAQQAPAAQQGVPLGELERIRMPDGTVPLAKVPLKPQPGAAGNKRKPRMKGKARQQWAQHYKNIATTMGLSTSNPKAVFQAVQKTYPGTYQKGMSAKQLYDAVSKKALSGQTSG